MFDDVVVQAEDDVLLKDFVVLKDLVGGDVGTLMCELWRRRWA